MFRCLTWRRLMNASSLAAIIAVLNNHSVALAADTTIRSGQTVGQQSIADNDRLIIENGATVTDGTAVVDAVNGTTINVINNGTINSTTGDGVDANDSTLNMINTSTVIGDENGIRASVIESLVNSGTIRGDDNEGIDVSGQAIISNLAGGVIIGDSDGVNAGNNSNVNNAGRIEGDDEGVELGNDSTLVNSGTIVSGPSDEGVQMESNAIVQNSGTINGGNSGIEIRSGSITNSGTITGDEGIEVTSDDATVVNSGTITGTNGTAIDFDNPARNTLHLQAGSVLNGVVSWDGINDTLIMAPGMNGSVTFDNLPDTRSIGSPLFRIVGNTITQADVSTMAAMGTFLDDMTGGIGGLVSTRIDAASFPLAQGSSHDAFGRQYWFSAWGAASRADGDSTTADISQRAGGPVFGVDWNHDDGDLYGVYGGAGWGAIDVDVSGGQETDTNSFYGGAYSKWAFGEGMLSLNMLVGRSEFDSRRPVGGAVAVADYDGWFVSPSLGYSKVIDLGGDQATASATIGYSGLFLDGYSETGSGSNLTVASRDIHQLNARGELSWLRTTTNSNGSTTNFSPFVGIEGRVNVGDNDATATLLGQTVTFNPGGDEGVGRAFVGMKFNQAISEATTVFGRVEASYDTSETYELNGQIGFAVKF